MADEERRFEGEHAESQFAVQEPRDAGPGLHRLAGAMAVFAKLDDAGVLVPCGPSYDSGVCTLVGMGQVRERKAEHDQPAAQQRSRGPSWTTPNTGGTC
jgi:hypothetical protein